MSNPQDAATPDPDSGITYEVVDLSSIAHPDTETAIQGSALEPSGLLVDADAPIIVDASRPGESALPAPFIASDVDPLTSERLTDLGDVLTVSIPEYPTRRADDVIHLFGDSTSEPGPQKTVSSVDPGEVVEVQYTRAQLEKLGDGQHELFYTVIDRAGNFSHESPRITVRLDLTRS
ncbi:hypothetical protein [Nocardia sp. NBC_01327]|uniref:hypothetical protein n=1 Tax=Nocardia sp. NBC_01327 TaxID=2903593 RepID=UPI002E13A1AC|nr:hypothetical protein OG326_06000 [Nocardia sp. NBC_01327]